MRPAELKHALETPLQTGRVRLVASSTAHRGSCGARISPAGKNLAKPENLENHANCTSLRKLYLETMLSMIYTGADK